MRGSQPKFTERNDEIVRRYLAGESIGALGREYGISRQRVFQIAQKRNEYRAPRRELSVGSIRWTKQQRQAGLIPNWNFVPTHKTIDMLAMRERGLTFEQIGTLSGVTTVTAFRAVKKWRPDLRGWGISAANRKGRRGL